MEKKENKTKINTKKKYKTTYHIEIIINLLFLSYKIKFYSMRHNS